jgi:2,3-bisphosphoglycerate-dependent phosphoglycerate mutase
VIESDGQVIFVKHSLPEIMPDIPANQWKLGEEGRKCCLTLGKALKPYEADAIVSSIEPKAVETAALIANILGLSHQIVEGLHEHQRDNESFDKSDANFQDKIARFFDQPDKLIYGRETGDQADGRFLTAVKGVVEMHRDGKVIIVTHGTVMSLLLSRVNQFEPFPFWKSLGLPSFVVTTSTFRLLKVVTGVKSG